jgi:hypothetical protein
LTRALLADRVIWLLVAAALMSWLITPLDAGAAPLVPTMSQRSPRWAADHLGSDPHDTIGSSGCALTAMSMVHSAFGYSTNPRQLNRWLTEHGGYIENDLLLWRQAAADTRGGIRWRWLHVAGISPALAVDDQDIDPLPTRAMVTAELDQGHLVVAEVRLHGGMHFVVITGHQGGQLQINDPWYGDRTTLEARYGPYAQAVHSTQVYVRGGS